MKILTPNLAHPMPYRASSAETFVSVRFGELNRHFQSDTNAPVLPVFERAASQANGVYDGTYMTDRFSVAASQRFESVFGPGTMTFFVNNGSAANIVGLASVLERSDAVICRDTAHITTLEAGSPEAMIGCKLLTIRRNPVTATGNEGQYRMPAWDDGKLRVRDIKRAMASQFPPVFINNAKVISISQPTEKGVTYTADEIKQLAQYAHRHGMLLHVDGARLWHAAAAEGREGYELNTLKAMTSDAGVDILSLGGTKLGMDRAEALVFLPSFFSQYPKTLPIESDTPIRVNRQRFQLKVKRVLKQQDQLNSRIGAIANQFLTAFTNNTGFNVARQANRRAMRLRNELTSATHSHFILGSQWGQTNSVFLQLPKHVASQLAQTYLFFEWPNNGKSIGFHDPGQRGYTTARLVVSSQLPDEEITGFTQHLKRLLQPLIQKRRLDWQMNGADQLIAETGVLGS